MAVLDPFITLAQIAGLPVKLLRYVQDNYRIKTTDEERSYVSPYRNTLHLNKSKKKTLLAATLGSVTSQDTLIWDDESRAVNELYHEATHAYIDIKRDEARDVRFVRRRLKDYREEESKPAFRVDAVMTDAEKYYAITQLEGLPGWPVKSKGSEIAQEAAAMYVGARAGAFWKVIDYLTHWRELVDEKVRNKDPRRVDLIKKVLKETQEEYNEVMSERVVGYQTTGLSWWGININEKQRRVVNKRIPDGLKKMCDDLLERKVPDHFLSVPQLQRLANDILRGAKELEAMK